MTSSATFAAIFACVSALMFMASTAWTPILGIIFGLASLAHLSDCFSETPAKDGSAELQVLEDALAAEATSDVLREVNFSGRTGSDLVVPSHGEHSEMELKMMKHKADRIRQGRYQVPATV